MRIMLIHNFYTQPGGEDVVYRAECDLLRRHTHHVLEFVEDNRTVANTNPFHRATNAIWSRASYRRVKEILADNTPDVAHFHNTFLCISPAAYYACRSERVPVVQTLHNYRLICPNALLYTQGHVCEACLGHMPLKGVLRGCYRASRSATAVVAGMLMIHRLLGTWEKQVDIYIALTEFARSEFVEAGLPANRIVVKPNFLAQDPGFGEGKGNYALFVGRLAPEKGVLTLLKAWNRLGRTIPLKVAGDGPLSAAVAASVRDNPKVEWLGARPHGEVSSLMKGAAFLMFPSEWYETFGMVLIEALACGTPVVAARIGAAAETIEDGRTGLHFNPGDPEDLAAKVEWLLAHPRELAQMRVEARNEFLSKYTAERNYARLTEIYELAIERARTGR